MLSKTTHFSFLVLKKKIDVSKCSLYNLKINLKLFPFFVLYFHFLKYSC